MKNPFKINSDIFICQLILYCEIDFEKKIEEI